MEKYKIHINLFIVALGVVDLIVMANDGYNDGYIADGLSYWETFYYISLPETVSLTLYLLLVFNLFFKNRTDIKQMVGNSRIEQLEGKIAQMEYNKIFAIVMLFSVYLRFIPMHFPKLNQLLNGSLDLHSPSLLLHSMSVVFLAGMYFFGMDKVKDSAIKKGKTQPPA